MLRGDQVLASGFCLPSPQSFQEARPGTVPRDDRKNKAEEIHLTKATHPVHGRLRKPDFFSCLRRLLSQHLRTAWPVPNPQIRMIWNNVAEINAALIGFHQLDTK